MIVGYVSFAIERHFGGKHCQGYLSHDQNAEKWNWMTARRKTGRHTNEKSRWFEVGVLWFCGHDRLARNSFFLPNGWLWVSFYNYINLTERRKGYHSLSCVRVRLDGRVGEFLSTWAPLSLVSLTFWSTHRTQKIQYRAKQLKRKVMIKDPIRVPPSFPWFTLRISAPLHAYCRDGRKNSSVVRGDWLT